MMLMIISMCFQGLLRAMDGLNVSCKVIVVLFEQDGAVDLLWCGTAMAIGRFFFKSLLCYLCSGVKYCDPKCWVVVRDN